MERCFLSNPGDENYRPIRVYRRWMYSIWNEWQSFLVTERRLRDQAWTIHKNGWLTELQLADINKIMVNVSIEENEDNEVYVGEERRE